MVKLLDYMHISDTQLYLEDIWEPHGWYFSALAIPLLAIRIEPRFGSSQLRSRFDF